MTAHGNDSGNGGTKSPHKTMMLSVTDLHSVGPNPAPQVVGPPATPAPARGPLPGVAPLDPQVVHPPKSPLLGDRWSGGAPTKTDPPVTWSKLNIPQDAQSGPLSDASGTIGDADPDENEPDASDTQQIPKQGARKFPRGAKIAGTVVAIVGALAAAVLITIFLTGSKANPAPATATAPAAQGGDEGVRALDLANRQGQAFNAFLAQLGPQMQNLHERLTKLEELEKTVAAQAAKIAAFEQTLVALQQGAGTIEIIRTEESGDETGEPAAQVGTDNLVIDPAPADKPIDPATIYTPEKK